MIERILRVFMILVLLFAFGMVSFWVMYELKIQFSNERILVSIILAVAAITLASMLQYIIIGKWNPFALFIKEKDK